MCGQGGGDFGYYVWYKVDGVGVDPALPSRTGILIDLKGGDSAESISIKTAFALNSAGQVTSILTVAASAIPAGAYFTANSSTDQFYVWYKKDGMGTDPKPAGRKPILVEIISTDTAAQVASKTQRAINMKYFASPDFRGYFLRALGDIVNVDDDTATRSSFIPGVIGNVLGTFQLDSLKSHYHDVTIAGIVSSEAGGGATIDVVNGTQTVQSASTGSYEVRPINKNVNYAIRY